jgi:hypothetical protein
LIAQAVQTAQDILPSLHGICLPGMDFSIPAQGAGMAISAIVIAMPRMGSGALAAAQDGPTPLRNSPSTRQKAVNWRPKNRANMRWILQAGPLWIKKAFDQPGHFLMAVRRVGGKFYKGIRSE